MESRKNWKKKQTDDFCDTVTVMVTESYHLLFGSQEQGQHRQKEIQVDSLQEWPDLNFKATEELLYNIVAVLMYWTEAQSERRARKNML